MADEDPQEAAWIERARGGDPRAFEELVRLHQRPVYGLAMRMLRDHDDADDVAQRTFLRAWDHLHEFEGRCQLRSWLFRICMNLCKNHHRDRARFVDTPAPPEPAVEAVGSERMEREAVLEKLREAVAALPPKQRATVEMRIYQDLPFKEIAAALETTENSSKVSFHLAVKTLKARLGDLARLLSSAEEASR
jgi:RNA polymerase sigma-70 factor (ECF subfamily)